MPVRFWILKGREVVPAIGAITWAREFENFEARRIGNDVIDGQRVSTVFLGIDHSIFEDGPPLIFETMIFGGPHDGYIDRCSTYEQAEGMHKVACDLVRKKSV